MSKATKPYNTANRPPLGTRRSGAMRHEASDGSSEIRKLKRPEALVSVKPKRRIRYGPDVGGPRTNYQLRFATSRRGKVDVEVESTMLLKPNLVLERVIEEHGLFPADAKTLREQILKCTQTVVPTVERTTITGWKGEGESRAFVTPVRTFGPGRRSFEFAASLDHAVGDGQVGTVRGDLESWRASVGQYLEMSSVGRVLLGAALAAPLLAEAGLSESWIFLLAGPSTAGKSTLLKAVASFQGAASPVSPRTTDRRFNELAAKHNDLVFVVGDLSQLDNKDRRRVLHWLAMDATAGQPRSVSRMMRTTLPDLPFTTIAALSAEQSSAEIADGAGARRLVGESVRCFDLLPGPNGYFDTRPKRRRLKPEEVAARINSGADSHHGAGLKAWIDWLSDRPSGWLNAKVRTLIDKFVEEVDRDRGLDSRERRAARKFGLVYAGLVLGRKAQITDLSRKKALRAVSDCLRRSMASSVAVSPEGALSALKAALEAPDAMLRTFQGGGKVKADARSNPDWLGLITKRAGQRAIGLRPPAVRKAIGRAQAELAFANLEQAGWLKRPKGAARWQKRVPGVGKVRLLELNPDWLGGDR